MGHSKRYDRWNRRRFLKGLGGATLALPFLETLHAKGAWAAAPNKPLYTVIMRQGNGVQQAYGNNPEPERFWPSATGAITQATLAGRAVEELSDYASRMLCVRGVNHPFSKSSCGHSQGGAMLLTAQQNNGGVATDTMAYGESVDNLIARELHPTKDPLTLMSGKSNGYVAEVLSYRGSLDRRSAETNPHNVYLDLFTGGATPEITNALAAQRNRINDLVRGEMQQLMALDLSVADQQRLDKHFTSIVDLEDEIACVGPSAGVVTELQEVMNNPESNDNLEKVARLHARLIALAFACDLRRVATLQVGHGNDSTKFTIDGVLQNTFHRISHRIDSDGSDGPPIPNADVLHHQIDRIHGQIFKFLLDRMDEQVTIAGGNLLDDSVAVWTNDLSTGPPHGNNNLPHVLVGSGGGFLKQGQFIDVGGETNNKFLNTLINAAGIRKPDGSLWNDFGDPSLDPGWIPEMLI